MKKIDIEELADYLIQNATEAFEHQDRELLIKALERCDILKTEKI